MIHALQRFTRSDFFNRAIMILILLSGALVGIETYPQFSPSSTQGRAILLVQDAILWIFLLEIVLKMAAHGAKPWRYFRSGANVFDFTIVFVCFLPIDSQFATVFRMVRLLRAMRLLTIMPGLQVLVSALLRAIPALGYVGLLLLLHFYIYAVTGSFLFSQNDPIRFGKLHNSMMTLFEVLTLEGWNEVLNTQVMGSDLTYDDEWKTLAATNRVSEAQPLAAAAFFVSFILLGTMIMLNLFTGVIISSMEDAQSTMPRASPAKPAEEEPPGSTTMRDTLGQVTSELKEISANLAALREQMSEMHAGSR